MSHAKSFGAVDQEKSVEERMVLLESKIVAYQDRIASYDKLIDVINDLHNQLKAVHEKTNLQKAALDNLGEGVAKLHNSLVDRLQALNSDYQLSKENFNELARKHYQVADDRQNKIHELSLRMDKLKEDLMDHLKAKANKDDIIAIQQKLAQGLDLALKPIEALHNEMEANHKDVHTKIDALCHSKMDMGAYEADYKNLNSQMFTLNCELQAFKHDLPQQLVQLSIHSDQNMTNLRSEFNSKPSEIADFKNEMLKKLEMVALDGTNAVVRSQNADQKVYILEKKMENLSLLLKKFELNQK